MNPASLIQLPADVMHTLPLSHGSHADSQPGGAPTERSFALALALVAACAALVFGIFG